MVPEVDVMQMSKTLVAVAKKHLWTVELSGHLTVPVRYGDCAVRSVKVDAFC